MPAVKQLELISNSPIYDGLREIPHRQIISIVNPTFDLVDFDFCDSGSSCAIGNEPPAECTVEAQVAVSGVCIPDPE